MHSFQKPLVWDAALPPEWPLPPSSMTVTTLREIETCPRRWALNAASYPLLWDGYGYPPRVQVGRLSGTVVHRALEQITRGLIRQGCPSLQDPAAFQIIKTLGGYSKIIGSCMDEVLSMLVNNPRAARISEYADRSLRSQMGELRTQVQTMLSRIRIPQSSPAIPAKAAPGIGRRPLVRGAYAEVDVRAPAIAWKGRIDLLVIEADNCEITDFKTGQRDDTHQFQVSVYALLWNRDHELNPAQRRINHLYIAYANESVEYPSPSPAELAVLEQEITSRGESARRAIGLVPPEARPTKDSCRFCNVRHLCPEYWAALSRGRFSEEDPAPKFSDAQITITANHGPSSWDAQVDFSLAYIAGMRAIVRTNGDITFQSGDRVRVLDVAISFEPEGPNPPVILTIGSLTEIYRIPASPSS
jgi:hypothetical protein